LGDPSPYGSAKATRVPALVPVSAPRSVTGAAAAADVDNAVMASAKDAVAASLVIKGISSDGAT
jgi:hypothetical protein